MIEQNDTPFRDMNRFQQVALLLTDIYSHLKGLEYLFPKQEIPEILSEIIQNEINILLLNYSFAYYGLTGQLVNQAQYKDAEIGMKELIGWDQKEKKDELKAIHLSGIGGRHVERGDIKKGIKVLKEALGYDPDNPMVLVNLVKAYVKKGDLVSAERYRQKGARFFLNFDIEKENQETENSAKIKFEDYIKKFEKESLTFKKIQAERPYYKNILDENQGILIQLQILLKQVRRFFKGKDIDVPKEKISDILEDVMNIYFNWLSIISGSAYYFLKFNFDNENFKEKVIDALAKTLGYIESDSIPSPIDIKQTLDSNQELLEEMDLDSKPNQLIDGEIELILDKWGVPTIIDYENEEMKKLLQNPNQIVIEEEQIKIQFDYPLSTEVYLEYMNEGGFSRLDLWRCIYSGYKKIYDEEHEDAGDPGPVSERVLNRARSSGRYGIWGHYMSELWLEGIIYDPHRRLVILRIGS